MYEAINSISGPHKNTIKCQVRWHTPLIPAFRRQRQVDLTEFEVSLVYKSRTRTVSSNSVSKQNKPHTRTCACSHTHTHYYIINLFSYHFSKFQNRETDTYLWYVFYFRHLRNSNKGLYQTLKGVCTQRVPLSFKLHGLRTFTMLATSQYSAYQRHNF